MMDQVFFLIVLLLLSGFFSSAETALFSISQARARHIAKDGRKPDKLIQRMKENPHNLLTTILIGNNVVNIGAAAMATALAIKVFPNYAVGLATGIMTFLVLVFGEVLPKTLATRNNILIARITIYPIYWLSLIFLPLLLFLNFIPKIAGKIKRAAAVSEEELMTFVEVVEEEGEIKEEEKELIENIFEFDDTNASEIMTPRGDMFVIDANKPMPLGAMARSGFTRIPVFEKEIDHVIGIINVKDLFTHQATTKEPIEIRKIMREPYFVPENKKLDRLLHQFKKRKTHLAVVVDEHGGISGLITLEDALEELVGEIRDETDKDEPQIVKVNDGEWIVPGKTEIDDINDTMPMKIPDSSAYDTFSGYVLDVIGRIPEESEMFQIDGFEVTVKHMEGPRITEYAVKEIPPPGKDTPHGS